jgi:hypothetical protein
VNLDLLPVRRVLALLALAIALLPAVSKSEEVAPSALGPTLPGPSRQVLTFDHFIGKSGPICLERPAAECVDVAWGFADTNHDQGLSVEELQALRDGLRTWSAWRAGDFTNVERSLLALGFLVVDGLGVARLHALYDADGNGLVDREELLADVRMDDRPLGEILLDREAVDRAAVAARLGLPPVLLERLQP